MKKIILLFLGAVPTDQEDLGHGDEVRMIKQAIRDSAQRQAIQIEIELSVPAEEFTEHVIQHAPKILHLSFHGDLHQIYFKSEVDGGSQGVPAEALILLGKACKHTTKIMLISCCRSDEIACELSKSIAFVIGMKEEVSVEAANAFAGSFYRALFNNNTVQESFDYGVAQVAALGIYEEDLPQLFTNEDATNTKFLTMFDSHSIGSNQSFDKADLVLKSVLTYGGVFATADFDMGRKKSLVIYGKDANGKGPPQWWDPGGTAFGVVDALQQKWLTEIPAHGSEFNQDLQMFEQKVFRIYLLTLAGRKRIDDSELVERGHEVALELLRQVPEQFIIRLGIGWLQVSGAQQQPADIGLGLAFALHKDWIRVAGDGFVVTDAGRNEAN